MRRALVIVNSKASQAADRFREIAEHLQAGNLTVEQGTCESEGDYRDLLRGWQQRMDLLVVAGGDGTVRCAAEAILTETGGKLPLGIIPLGTANNVARSLDLPLQVQQACAVIVAGQLLRIDLGRVNGRVFVSVLGMGLSTEVHESVPSDSKKRWGSLSYAMQALKLLLSRPPFFRATIRSDEEKLRVKALQVTVCNGRYYGAHLEIHPEASLNDGWLDLSVVEAGNFWRGLFKAMLPLKSGHASAGLRLLRSKTFDVTTTPVVKIDVEGATDLQTPERVELLPAAMDVFVPKKA